MDRAEGRVLGTCETHHTETGYGAVVRPVEQQPDVLRIEIVARMNMIDFFDRDLPWSRMVGESGVQGFDERREVVVAIAALLELIRKRHHWRLNVRTEREAPQAVVVRETNGLQEG